jgi:hypothetical protein
MDYANLVRAQLIFLSFQHIERLTRMTEMKCNQLTKASSHNRNIFVFILRFVLRRHRQSGKFSSGPVRCATYVRAVHGTHCGPARLSIRRTSNWLFAWGVAVARGPVSRTVHVARSPKRCQYGLEQRSEKFQYWKTSSNALCTRSTFDLVIIVCSVFCRTRRGRGFQ